LPGECEQGHEFPLEAFDLFGRHDDSGTAVDQVHDGDRLKVSGGDQAADGAAVHLQAALQVVGGEAVVVGPAHQGADFLDVKQERHVAALGGEL